MKSVLVFLPVALLFASAYYLTLPTKSKEQLMVERINSQNLGWTATTYPDMDFRLGLLEGNLEMSGKLGFQHKSFTNDELQATPDSFDSRIQWPHCSSISDIRNQSKCGSCWAFAAATVLSDRLCIASKQTIQTRLSPQDVLSCCFSCGNGCDGGFSSGAWDYFIQSGIVSGNNYGDNQWCMSYQIPPDSQDHDTPPCRRTCQTNTSISYFNDRHKASSGYLLAGEEAFKKEISTNGPIVSGFTVYADFRNYKSGVYWHKEGDILGGHAIRIVGYGIEDGVKYWLIANTWSPTWGMQGFFKMRRGTNECGIETQGIAGLVTVN